MELRRRRVIGAPLTFEQQVAEIQVRVAVLNRYTALGKPVTEPVGYIRKGKGEVQQSRTV